MKVRDGHCHTWICFPFFKTCGISIDTDLSAKLRPCVADISMNPGLHFWSLQVPANLTSLPPSHGIRPCQRPRAQCQAKSSTLRKSVRQTLDSAKLQQKNSKMHVNLACSRLQADSGGCTFDGPIIQTTVKACESGWIWGGGEVQRDWPVKVKPQTPDP